MFYVEVEITVLTKIRSTEARLQCIGIHQTKFPPKNNTSCRLLRFLHRKVTITKTEDFRRLFEQAWEDLFFQAGSSAPTTTVHENVLLPAMAVKVNAEDNLTVFTEFAYHCLCMEDCGMQLALGVNPLSVKIMPGQVAAIVPVNDSIGIQHRHNLEHKVISQDLSIKCRAR
jgi:hypothetical protein